MKKIFFISFCFNIVNFYASSTYIAHSRSNSSLTPTVLEHFTAPENHPSHTVPQHNNDAINTDPNPCTRITITEPRVLNNSSSQSTTPTDIPTVLGSSHTTENITNPNQNNIDTNSNSHTTTNNKPITLNLKNNNTEINTNKENKTACAAICGCIFAVGLVVTLTTVFCVELDECEDSNESSW